MVREWMILFVIIVLIGGVSALSTTLGDTYEQRETMIGQLSDDIIDIDQANANVLRDGHIELGFNGEIKKLGGSYYIWLPAPQNSGSYTLVVEDVIASVGGFPDVVTLEHDFIINESVVDYSLGKGLVFSSGDFDIDVILYEDFSQTIDLSYPESRSLTINPGNNNVNFNLEEFVGSKLEIISVGKYSVPVYLIGQESVCGDGVIDSGEVCDGNNLGGETCIDQGFDTGTLICNTNCIVYDLGGCEDVGLECGSANLDLCLSEGNCTGSGGFWYENSCNEFEEGAECDEEHLGLCETQGTCIDSNGYWYDGECNPEEEIICDNENLENCDTLGKCFGAEGFWYDGQCNEEEEREFDFRFEFVPRIIKKTILAGEEPGVYNFRLENFGEALEDLVIEYDRRDFIISPERVSSLGVNESVEFNISVRNFRGVPVRGAAIVSIGEVSEYLLFDLQLTDDITEVGTQVSNGSSGGGYYCSELSGSGCNEDEICSGEVVSSLDKSYCCVSGVCEESNSGGSYAWIGYLIAAIVILILLIVYVKYKGAGKVKSPTQRRFASAEKKLP